MPNTYVPTSTTQAPSPDLTSNPLPPDRRWITAALLLVMVLASMEATVTSTAMPTIVGHLHGFEHYSWVASIYLLASTITMPLYGRLSDILGRKRVLLFSILLFAIASLLASLSQSMLQLILFRGMQGLGAGGIMPVVLTILGDIFTLQERAKMQGIFSAVWGTASLAGPLLGAFLVTTDKLAPYLPAFLHPILGWPSIFWVNLPAGFAGVLVLLFKYHDHHLTTPATPGTTLSSRLDLPGATLLAIGSSTLLVAVSLAASSTIPHYVPLISLLVGLATMYAFIRREYSTDHPLMPPALMLKRAIGPSMLASATLGVGVFALDTYVPLYVQGGRGMSAGAAAACVTPVMLAWATSGLIAAPLMIKHGFRKMAVAGALLISIGFVGLLIATLLNAHLWVLTTLLFLTGLGFGPSSMAMLLSAQEAVEWQQRGIITSGITFSRNFGGALGVGLLGALFNLLSAHQLQSIVNGKFSTADLLNPELLKSVQARFPDILTRAQTTIAHALIWVFAAMLLASIVQILVSRLISAHKADRKLTAAEMMEGMA